MRRERRERQSGKLRMPWHKKVHRNVKDRLFRFLFDKDKEALLQLYNALNGTNYQDSGMKLQAALNVAVDYCVAHGILDSTLREHRADALVKAYGTVIGTIRPFCVQKEEHELKRVIIHDLKHGKQIKTEENDAKMMQKRYRIDVSLLYNVNDEENV